MAQRLKNLKITEVSSVDRGAGEGVKVVLSKRDEIDKVGHEVTVPEAEITGTKPSHTITQPANRGKKKPPVTATITSKGETAMDEALARAGDALSKSVHSIYDDPDCEGETLQKALAETIGQHTDYILKLVAETATSTVAKGEPMSDETNDMLKARNDKMPADSGKHAPAKMDGGKEDMVDDANDDTNAGDRKAGEPSTARSTTIDKAALPEEIRKALEEAETMKKRLEVLETKDAIVEHGKIAKAHGLSETMGETVLKAYRGDKESVTKLLDIIKAQTAQLKTSKVFSEFGRSGEGTTGTAYEQLMAKASELRKADPKLSEHQAFEKVYTDKANVELKDQYKREQRSAS